MPTYCFTCNTCVTTEEIVCSWKDRPAEVVCPKCGVLCRRDVQAEAGGVKDTLGNWPLDSEAVGCHPDQVGEFNKVAKKITPGVEFLPGGKARFHSKKARTRYCKAMGYKDRCGGYDDP